MTNHAVVEACASVAEIERAILAEDVDRARSVYRSWLLSQVEEPVDGWSIGDLLLYFSDRAHEYSNVAVVTLRCAVVQGVIFVI